MRHTSIGRFNHKCILLQLFILLIPHPSILIPQSDCREWENVLPCHVAVFSHHRPRFAA